MSTDRIEPPSVENLTEARRAIEAMLMVASDPTPVQLLAQLVELPVAIVQSMCEELAAEYEDQRRGFQLVAVAGGWRYQTHPDTHAYVERFALEGIPNRLSSAALETLAIVAYKQPISRAQIGAIRGVNVDGVLRTLAQRGYVDEQGRDDGPGQATLFGTTPFFLEQLGLMSLDDLPALGDFVPSVEVLEALEHTLRVDGEPEVAPVEVAQDDDAAQDDVAQDEVAEDPGVTNGGVTNGGVTNGSDVEDEVAADDEAVAGAVHPEGVVYEVVSDVAAESEPLVEEPESESEPEVEHEPDLTPVEADVIAPEPAEQAPVELGSVELELELEIELNTDHAAELDVELEPAEPDLVPIEMEMTLVEPAEPGLDRELEVAADPEVESTTDPSASGAGRADDARFPGAPIDETDPAHDADPDPAPGDRMGSEAVGETTATSPSVPGPETMTNGHRPPDGNGNSAFSG